MKKTTKEYDPYNVYEYSDPEEVYYWEKDNFYDYKEAEEYWNEHCK